ncbi:MAG: glycosyl transferase family 2 [Rhodospirillales bacterium RIFCSPLOWO2_12_FULL_67_15]|nr:MAG: glycosyl transferase family 2 [Rhodospirillales bacterium RIFCSPLOWO2_12_FULL_67_15]
MPANAAPRSVAVVVPCYRETARILDVLARIGPEVARIVVVDDACPDGTGRWVRERSQDPRVEVILHDTNQGVGGATMTGYRRALEAGADIIVKLDGDGQMDPELIPVLIEPLLAGETDYAKGNRFRDPDGLSAMPPARLIGNLVLSFASKVSSGYWDLFDPTNGFTAIHAKVVRALPLAKISRSFFFESDMLFRLYLLRAVVTDIPMRARYGGEQSTLRITQVIGEFALKHHCNAIKRILYTYFLRDFTAASVELVLGLLLLLFGTGFGLWQWNVSIASGVPATAGTVLLAALPVILGVQLLLAFLHFDIGNVPRRPIHPGL